MALLPVEVRSDARRGCRPTKDLERCAGGQPTFVRGRSRFSLEIGDSHLFRPAPAKCLPLRSASRSASRSATPLFRKTKPPVFVSWGMPRRLRLTPPGSVVEITQRTVQGRFLLRPSPQLNRVALGVLGRAQRKYSIPIHSFGLLSNHYHLSIEPESARQQALLRATSAAIWRERSATFTTGAARSGVVATRRSRSPTSWRLRLLD